MSKIDMYKAKKNLRIVLQENWIDINVEKQTKLMVECQN